MALRDSDPLEVGGYLIEDRLGSGGMGVVYLARSASGRRLAVKVVHHQYADDDEFRTRFRRELAAARRVSGAFTAPVVDADADAPRPWMATLYIPGQTLGHHVREHGPLPLPALRELAAGLAEALRDIHRAGVVHRDLKPANVMLAEDGPRVIDFGISRATEFAPADALTQTGRVMGTPPFMSPEQFSAPHDVGPAADVFSLGAILTFAATGRGPFDSPSPYETAVRVVQGAPDLKDAPSDLVPFIRLCLEKHPKSRPTAHELLTHLHEGSVPRRRPAGEGAASGAVAAGAVRSRPRPGDGGEGGGSDGGRGDAWPGIDASQEDGHDFAGPLFAHDSATIPAARVDGSRPASRPATGQPNAGRQSNAGLPSADHSNAGQSNAGLPGADPARRRRRIRRLLLGWGAAAVALAAVAAGVLALQDGDRGSGGHGSGEVATVSELPAGWRPWHARAEGREGTGASFERCAAVRASLVCAGDDLMAAGWALADGGGHWSRPVDPTHGPDDGYSSMGALIGVHEGNVLTFGADDPSDTDGTGQARYTVQSLDAATGRVVWQTVTGRGVGAVMADPSSGLATAVPEGVIAVYGDSGDEYALLDAGDGRVVWRRTLPEPDDCEFGTAAGEPYLLCRTDDGDSTGTTTISRLDRATGEPLWTTEAAGVQRLLGQAHDHLVLAELYSENQMTTLTLVDVATQAVTRTRLSPAPPATGVPHVVHGTVYFTLSSGSIRAYDPLTGEQRWENNSTVEHPGPPTVSGDRMYVASSTGRMAALNLRTGAVEASRPGRDDATGSDFIATGSPLVLVDDALYVPYGPRSVYTVDVNDL
jgi:outer membrane protein assembly factor BamB